MAKSRRRRSARPPGSRWAFCCVAATRERLSLPHSRPMPSVGRHCHELRVTHAGESWRLIYRIDADAIVILEVFAKKTARTPREVVHVCRQRLKRYDDAGG